MSASRRVFLATAAAAAAAFARTTRAAAVPVGTPRTAAGEILRGTPLVISGNSELRDRVNPFATDPATMTAIRARGLNTVRLCLVDPYYEVQRGGLEHFTPEEQLPLIDRVVDNAAAQGLTVIVNYHSFGEHEGLRHITLPTANRYWDAIAPRYADRDHVFYEPVNEPTFQQHEYLDPTFRRNFTSLYRKIRRLAPERQVLMFSFNHLNFDFQTILDAYDRDMDWSHTSVAWHAYGKTTSLRKIAQLMRRYRCICTEWNYPGTFDYVPESLDGYRIVVGAIEKIGCGWCDWRDWDQTNFHPIDQQLLPDAHARGYRWSKNLTRGLVMPPPTPKVN